MLPEPKHLKVVNNDETPTAHVCPNDTYTVIIYTHSLLFSIEGNARSTFKTTCSTVMKIAFNVKDSK